MRLAIFKCILSTLLLLLPVHILAKSTTGDRLLIVEEEDSRRLYNGYIWDLEQRGFDITYHSPKSPDLDLFTFGERNYDHLILLPLPKSKAYGPKLSTPILVDFINKKGNILILLDPTNIPEQIRDLGRELDIGLAPRGEKVVDHFQWLPGVEGNEYSHDIIIVPKPTTAPEKKNLFGGWDDKEEMVAFVRGTGHTLGNSPLLHPILQAPRTSYSYDPREENLKSENPWTAGQQMYLTTGFQSRNNARVTFVGSAEMFGDVGQGLDGLRVAQDGHKHVFSNRLFANSVTGWTFQEIGVIKAEGVRHYLTSDAVKAHTNNTQLSVSTTGSTSELPSLYRVKSDVTYEIQLSEYVYDRWIPFQPPSSDSLQLEFTMLDPYYRLNLLPITQSLNSTTFSVNFTTPDQHGIFAFRVNYKRPYLSYIDVKDTVTVRHFAHDEYLRSYEISGAWVWLGGIVVVVVGWIGFVAVWLWSEPREEGKGRRKVAGKKA